MVSKSKTKSKKPVHNTVEPAHADTIVPSDIPSEKSVEHLIQELKSPNEIVRGNI